MSRTCWSWDLSFCSLALTRCTCLSYLMWGLVGYQTAFFRGIRVMALFPKFDWWPRAPGPCSSAPIQIGALGKLLPVSGDKVSHNPVSEMSKMSYVESFFSYQCLVWRKAFSFKYPAFKRRSIVTFEFGVPDHALNLPYREHNLISDARQISAGAWKLDEVPRTQPL